MSTVPAPQPRSRPPSTTREQLDELDALLQRMLELPVEPAGTATEDAAAPAALVEAPATADVAEPPVDLPPPPAPPDVPDQPAAGPGPGGEVPAVRAVEVSRNGNVPAPPAPGRGPAGAGEDAAPAWLGPVVRLNRLFDRATGPLGVAGYWLRRPRGRAVLGWTGLGLLALALGIVLLSWRGWF